MKKDITDKIKNLIITPDVTLKDALKIIDSGSERIAFVCDKNQFLSGILSDGDIRRAILNGAKLTDSIKDFYNQNPIVIEESNFTSDSAQRIMLEFRIEQIPIINEHKQIVDLITWDRLGVGEYTRHDFQNKIDVAVVMMAGGKGTRLDPFTRILPKPLIPIGDKPIAQVIMERFHSFGVEDFYLTVNYKGEMIKSYFDNSDVPFSIHYIWEKEFSGTAGSLRLLPDKLGETIIVTNCDILVQADYGEVIDFHNNNGNLITMLGSVQHHTIPYGVIEYGTMGNVDKIIEKPEYNYTVNTGVYILQRKILNEIPEGFFHITSLIDKLLAEKRKVGVYPVTEKAYIDIGQWEEYHNALKALQL